MRRDDDAALTETLVRLARVHKSPKALLRAILETHPAPRKKDVSHAAFRLMIEAADDEAAPSYQEVGLALRGRLD
jgi:hypothetical protein